MLLEKVVSGNEKEGMVCIQEGKPFPLADMTGLEGFFFSVESSGLCTLIVAFPNMSQKELDAVTHGVGRIGIFVYDNIAHIVCKFGSKLIGDCGYHAKWEGKDIEIAEPEDGMGQALVIYAVDSRQNIFMGGRMCGMGNKWTKELKRITDKQKEDDSFTKDGFLEKMAYAHARWTSKEMMQMASNVYRIGTKEE